MKIAIIGLGLIGGSLGRAILKHTDNTVLGLDTDAASMLKGKLLDAYSEELNDDNIKDADIVFLALCPNAAIKVMQTVAQKLKNGAIVADLCGNKRIVTEAMESLHKDFPSLSFVGMHPMAGREYSGISHSTAGLFEKAFIIATPVHTPIDALIKVKKLFLDIGAEALIMTNPQEHDKIIAYTSQLAHIVSSAYVKSPTAAEYLGFSAGSFRDLTRVAKLNPDMWTELFMQNKDNLLREIDVLIEHLGEYREALADGDAEKLNALLADGTRCKEAVENMRRERTKQ